MMESMAKSKKPYVRSLDVVRAVTIVSVIMVHSTWFTANGGGSIAAGAVLSVLHFTRESFMALTGFVLTYSLWDRPARWGRFWVKRYRLIAIPYIIWSAAYLTLSMPVWPILPYVSKLLQDLPTGAAWFHLYYLLITMQFYLLMPGFLWLIRRFQNHAGWLVGVVAVMEILLMAYDQYGLLAHPGGLNAYTGTEVWTYGLYFIIGGVMASRWPEISKWLESHSRAVLGFFVFGIMVMLGFYFGQLQGQVSRVNFADAVLQPAMVVESAAIFLALVRVGIWYQKYWRQPGIPWHARVMKRIADVSFGMYLMHPMILQGWLLLVHYWRWKPELWFLDGLTVVVLVVFSAAITGLLARTPWAPWIIGRSAIGRARTKPAEEPTWAPSNA